MKGLIDTNILIYAASETAQEYPKARAFLEKALDGPEIYVTTWINLAEYLSFTTQSFGGTPPLLTIEEARTNVGVLLESPKLRVITEGESHWEYLTQVLAGVGTARGSFVHDCRIAAIMGENGVDTIFTRDTDFRKFPGLKVVDPLA